MIIRFNPLDKESVEKAYKDVLNYKRYVQKMMPLIIEHAAKRCVELAKSNLLMAEGDSDAEAVAGEIHYVMKGKTATIRVTHEDAVYLEFGAGVFFNGNAGSYPHTNGSSYEGIVPIGEYGKGFGKNETWTYQDGLKLVVTHGTKCTEFMYRALQQLKEELPRIVREVLG